MKQKNKPVETTVYSVGMDFGGDEPAVSVIQTGESIDEKDIRKEISMNMSTMEFVVIMAEGNPGALQAMMQLEKNDPVGLLLAMHLDDMNIRGTQIWICYKDFCGQDLHKFIACIKNRDIEMIRFVNDYGRRTKNHRHQAVQYDAQKPGMREHLFLL